MPATRKAKRALQEADPNASKAAPAAKKPATGKGKGKDTDATSGEGEVPKVRGATNGGTGKSRGQKQTDDGNGSNATDGSRSEVVNAGTVPNDGQPPEPQGETDDTLFRKRLRRIPKGPNGESFLPRILPIESDKITNDQILPGGWTDLDGTPGHAMTLSNVNWWRCNSDWLKKHRQRLGLTDEQWRMESETMKIALPASIDEPRKDLDWICMCRPYSDYDLQKENDVGRSDNEDEDEDEDEDERSEADPCGKECFHGKFADRNPHHVWITTVVGSERMRWWSQEVMKRDQDSFDMYIYNDFSSYGTLEVLENAITAFDRVFSKKTKKPLSIWPEIEGLGLALVYGELASFSRCDDGDRCNAVIELVGCVVIAAIDFLIEKGQFKPGSEIRNLGLILATYLTFAQDQNRIAFDEATDWRYALVERAEEHEVKLAGPYMTETILEEIKDDEPFEYLAKFSEKINWKKELQDYARKYGDDSGARCRIGGDQYDISKFSKAKKKQHSF